MDHFTISIVLYHNNWNVLQKTIDSILSSSLDYNLFLVDNSTNDFLKNISNDNRIVYILNNSNIGFGSAHNIAIKNAIGQGAKYHIVINPDIYFEPGTVESIIEYMDQNPDVGLLMPQIRYPDGSLQYLPKLLPTPFDLLVRRLSLLRTAFSKRLEKYELKQFSGSRSFIAPIVSGCFSCFRIETLQRTGLYDERFFMYFEDFDLSRRIHKQYRTMYFSGAFVYHEYERGAQKNPLLFKIFFQSAVKYFSKWGWFIDKERKMINKKTLAQFK
jgi:GT2 family glycosyltransferase